MKSHLTITAAPLDEAEWVGQRRLPAAAGAVVCFVGVVRGSEDSQAIRAIEYETFRRMAEHQFEGIFREVEKQWPIHSLRVAHRVGVVKVGEPSFWVEVIAAHRSEAFAACQFLVNRMKRVVPIWKKALL
jgi:molybdopterin synthase catalytic subunit